MRRLIPIAILLAGVAVSALLISTGPELAPRAPVNLAPLVRTIVARPQSIQLKTSTHGTVEPRTESALISEVSGRVVSVSSQLVSGGFFSQDDVLLTIDTLDYEEALQQARAGLARAESELSNARKGYERQLDLAKKQSTSASQQDDALNRLRIAEASLKESRARLSRAERDLNRTRIVAPYDGRVRSEQIDVGQFVNRGTSIGTIYATDIAEVRLPIHDDELRFLDLPLTATPTEPLAVNLTAEFAGASHSWSGRIDRKSTRLNSSH